MSRLSAVSNAKDTVSKRHHYVPQTYLRHWSFDNKRIWALDTVTGKVAPPGLKDVCVKENFYRVAGMDGSAHNRVELLFGVVDSELGRVQRLLAGLTDPDLLEFDDLLGLGVSMATQRMRTPQERRVHLQYNKWLMAQDPEHFKSIDSSIADPHLAAGFHTQALFESMWDAADVLTTRQIEIWHDEHGRFMTCDAPVMVPYRHNERPSLLATPYIIWPISPFRVVALSEDLVGEKAVIMKATGRMVGLVREAVIQGRERMIFSSDEQRDRLPGEKKFRRRTQSQLTCSNRTPAGKLIKPPGCCVRWSQAFAPGPKVALCNSGLHVPAPDMWKHA
jgi:hypothetical protein